MSMPLCQVKLWCQDEVYDDNDENYDNDNDDDNNDYEHDDDDNDNDEDCLVLHVFTADDNASLPGKIVMYVPCAIIGYRPKRHIL